MALPWGSRIPDLSVTVTRAFMSGASSTDGAGYLAASRILPGKRGPAQCRLRIADHGGRSHGTAGMMPKEKARPFTGRAFNSELR
jgi:hypothetical protein